MSTSFRGAGRLLAAVVAAVLPLSLVAPSASAEPTGTVTGSVTDQFGNPVPAVRVYFEDPAVHTLTSVDTDGYGIYTKTGLAPATYRVKFDALSPYFAEYYNDKLDIASADPVVVTAGATTSGIDAVLERSGAISGHVTYADGSPASTVYVTVYQLGPSGFTVSADFQSVVAGTFDLRGLRAGTFRLKFRDWSRGFTEYWNDRPTLAAADDIVLAAAQFRSGIDVVLDKMPTEAVVNRQLPVVIGRPRVGHTLKVKGGAWTPAAVTLAYQWHAGSKKLEKATSKALRVTKSMLRKRLKVVITAGASGYASTVVTVKVKGKVHR